MTRAVTWPRTRFASSVHHIDDGGLKQGPADTARGTALARAPLDDPGGLAWCLRDGGRSETGHLVGQRRWRTVRVGGRRFLRTLRGAQGDAPEHAPQHHDGNTPHLGRFELDALHLPVNITGWTQIFPIVNSISRSQAAPMPANHALRSRGMDASLDGVRAPVP